MGKVVEGVEIEKGRESKGVKRQTMSTVERGGGNGERG